MYGASKSRGVEPVRRCDTMREVEAISMRFVCIECHKYYDPDKLRHGHSKECTRVTFESWVPAISTAAVVELEKERPSDEEAT